MNAAVPLDPTTGTYGGIDRATWTFWRNQFVDSTTASATTIQGLFNDLWVKQVLEHAETAFARSRGPIRKVDDSKDRRTTQLEEKLVNKNEVISELMEENVRAKKINGEL